MAGHGACGGVESDLSVRGGERGYVFSERVDGQLSCQESGRHCVKGEVAAPEGTRGERSKWQEAARAPPRSETRPFPAYRAPIGGKKEQLNVH